jgi:hypothetical protein
MKWSSLQKRVSKFTPKSFIELAPALLYEPICSAFCYPRNTSIFLVCNLHYVHRVYERQTEH